MRLGARILILTAALSIGMAGVAAAQGPAYTATPPTKGALYRDGQTSRYLLGGAWLYRADLGNVGLSGGWWRNVADTTGWAPVKVPNSYNAGDLSTASMNGYVGWYRRDFTIPAGAFARSVRSGDRSWIVRFESVNYRATVWLNGRQIGSHVGAYVPFELDLKGLHPGVNRLVIRVDDRHRAGDLPPGPNGGWWNYGGINREVYLRPVQRVDFQALQVRTTLRCPTCAATISEVATLRNLTSRRQTVRLQGRYGGARVAFPMVAVRPRATVNVAASVRLSRPHLWAPGHPYLYRATVSMSDPKGTVLGGWVTYSGVRQIAVTSGGRLTLNGRLLDLRGFSLHEQDLAAGAAISQARTAQLVNWVRELGATLIRAHYPLSPELQEQADRDGLLIWSEIPVYQVASQYLTSRSWLAQAHAMLKANILTNQDHPSVLLWSVANELSTPADGGEASYLKGAASLARSLDPTRPVGMAISAWPGVGCQSAYAPLNVIGYNDYFGWYDAGGGTTDDRDALSPYLDSLRACYPKKALFVSEFGFEANRNGPVEERGTYAFQSNSLAFHLAVFATKPWLSGAIYFALQDFAVTPGWTGGNPEPDPPFHQKGIFDLYGHPKPAAAVISAIYHAVRQIGPAAGR